jgi:hypothetical protein
MLCYCVCIAVMIAWTGFEHFVAGRFDDPPAADEPDDMLVHLGFHLSHVISVIFLLCHRCPVLFNHLYCWLE